MSSRLTDTDDCSTPTAAAGVPRDNHRSSPALHSGRLQHLLVQDAESQLEALSKSHSESMAAESESIKAKSKERFAYQAYRLGKLAGDIAELLGARGLETESKRLVDSVVRNHDLSKYELPSSDLISLGRALQQANAESSRACDGDAASKQATVAPPTDSKAALPQESQRPFVVRMDPVKLEHLMEYASDLSTIEARLKERLRVLEVRDDAVAAIVGQLAKRATDVRRSAMSMRMVPAAQLFGRSTNRAKQIAKESGKEIGITVVGEKIEVDKAIAEALSQPLLEVVSLVVSKSLETPAERIQAGKPSIGNLRIQAQQSGGEIVFEISDDGRGVRDVERSLAETRNQLSGLRGTVEVHCAERMGTTICLRLPLTLSIIQGIVVAIDAWRMIVPLYSIQEIARVSEVSLSFKNSQRAVGILRGELIPVFRLAELCGYPITRSKEPELLMISGTKKGRIGLLVDELLGTEEVFVKALDQLDMGSSAIRSFGVLSNGRIEPILDISALMADIPPNGHAVT